MQLELLRVIADRRGFERIAVLLLEIVDVVQAEGAEPVPIGPRRKGVVKQLARGQRRSRRRAQGGVGLVAETGLNIAAELVGLQLLVDVGYEVFAPPPQRRRQT